MYFSRSVTGLGGKDQPNSSLVIGWVAGINQSVHNILTSLHFYQCTTVVTYSQPATVTAQANNPLITIVILW